MSSFSPGGAVGLRYEALPMMFEPLKMFPAPKEMPE